jgi:ketosteroid isomerase-like protein
MRSVLAVFFIFLLTYVTAAGPSPLLERSLHKGIAASQRKDFDAALKEFQRAADLAAAEAVPETLLGRIHYNIGVCMYQTNRAAEAVTEFQVALSHNKNYERAFYALGMAEFDLNNWAAAESAYLSALAIDRWNGETWFDLGRVYLAKNDLVAANKAFEIARRYKSVGWLPDKPKAMSSLENKQLMQNIFLELAKGNSQPLRDSLAENCNWTVSGTTAWSGTYTGKQAILTRLLIPLREKLAGQYTNTAHRFIAEGDLVVVECQGHSTTKTGMPYNNKYCFIFRIRDGKLLEVTEYMDTQLAANVLGEPKVPNE